MKKTYKLTKDRYDAYRQELEYLKTVRDKEVAEQIKEALSFGDLSENSEYDEAKNEQQKLYTRIAELQNILSQVEIIQEERVSSRVDTGCYVVLRNLDDGETEEYQIVGSQESNPILGRISDESPVGKALLGHCVGEEIVVQAPAAELRFFIEEIR